MVDGKTALGHDLLEVTIGERVSQIPTDTQENDDILEMPPSKQCWPFSDDRYTLPDPLTTFATQPLAAFVVCCTGCITNETAGVLPPDNGPWGHYIYSVIKQGSFNLAYESRRMAIPNARLLGLRSLDYGRRQLSPSVQIKLNEQDIKRARQIAQYPWFVNKKPWQQEIALMLKNGFKLEVEPLISKDISYVTEEYVPALLKVSDFLD